MLQAYHPNSKAAAMGASAMSTSASAGSKAYNKEFLRTGSVGSAAKAGLLSGAQGIAQGAISSVPGGKSIARGISPMIGGFMGGGLKGGLAGLARGIMTSPTLGSDVANLFKRSTASDYNEGTWGSNMTNIEDENKQDEKAGEDKAKLAQQPQQQQPQQPAGEGAAAGEAAAPAGEAGQQQQPQPQQQGEGATEVAPGTIEAENAATDERVRRMGGVYGTVDENGIPHPPAAAAQAGAAAPVPAVVGGVGQHGEGNAAAARNQQVQGGGQVNQNGQPQNVGENVEDRQQGQGVAVPQVNARAPIQPQQQQQQQPQGQGEAPPNLAGAAMAVAPPLQEAGRNQPQDLPPPQQPQGQAAQVVAPPQEQPQAQFGTLESDVDDLSSILKGSSLDDMSADDISNFSNQLDAMVQRAENMEDLSPKGQILAHAQKHNLTQEDAENSMPRDFYFNHEDNKGKYEDAMSQEEMEQVPLQAGANANLIDNENARRDDDDVPYYRTPFGLLRAYNPDDDKTNHDESYNNLLRRMQDDLQKGKNIEAERIYNLLPREDRGIRLTKDERLKNHTKILKELRDVVKAKAFDTDIPQNELDAHYNNAQKHYNEIPQNMRGTLIAGNNESVNDIFNDINSLYQNNRHPSGLERLGMSIRDIVAPLPPQEMAPVRDIPQAAAPNERGWRIGNFLSWI
jgi:hypothetical protein